jgi:hypothetical protein
MMGVKTCVGTESALTVPENLQFRLKSQGFELNDPQITKKLYNGIFKRILRTYPLDYYWLWTPEDWTWNEISANKDWRNLVHQLLLAGHTKGEMGTIANLQQHNMDYLDLLTKYDNDIVSITGEPLPESAMPDRKYSGPDRIIVPTRRTMININEDFKLKIIVLSEDSITRSTLYWRNFGVQKFDKKPIDFIKKGHGTCSLPASEFSNSDFEYYLTVELSNNNTLRFPTAAPEVTRTIVINPD